MKLTIEQLKFIAHLMMQENYYYELSSQFDFYFDCRYDGSFKNKSIIVQNNSNDDFINCHIDPPRMYESYSFDEINKWLDDKIIECGDFYYLDIKKGFERENKINELLK